jgi:coenzyme F420-0:L-glutamate ligase
MSESWAADHAAERIEVLPVRGIRELRPGDDLAAAIVEHASLRDGDVLVVTSKIVSKVEGRLISVGSTEPAERERVREEAINSQTARLVAQRGPLRIVQTRQGLVLAAAGVDESNVARDEIALMPEDPDKSAAALREQVRERTGADVGVIISDSMGRPWRAGITDAAIGVAGLSAVFDARGKVDSHGNTLEVTTVAVADEIAAAADLVKGKLTGIPVAIVRGVKPLPDDGLGSTALIRGADEDLFRLGTAEAIAIGREDAGGATDIAPPLHADAVEVVTAFAPDSSVRQAFLAFLAARPDATWRSCVPGHLTASALVLDPSRRTALLTLHPRVGKWLPVGGHCEHGDRSVLDAAAREAREESGLGTLSFDPVPLELAVYPVTCSLGVPTRHLDICYYAVAPDGAEPVISVESLDLRWFSWDDLPGGISPAIPGLIAAARARLG